MDADLGRIVEILNEAIANTTAVWSLEPTTLQVRRAWLTERQAGGFPVLAALSDARIVGFAAFGPFRPWAGYAATVEHSIYVEPAAQGQGVGQALLAALISRAGLLGVHVMVAGIEAANIASIAIHAKAGFEQTGRLREVGRKFDRWLDLVFMQKVLEG